MQKQNDTREDENRIKIDRQKMIIEVDKPLKKVSYLILSTEPGRKIYHPPETNTEEKLQYKIVNNRSISEQLEGFCAVGLSTCMTEIAEVIEKKRSIRISYKTLYFSKMKIIYKTLQCFHTPRNSQNRFILNVQPPQDLNAHEIQQILELSQKLYGVATQIDIKRNSLILTYEQEKTPIKNFIGISVKSNMELEHRVKLNYWTVTNHHPRHTCQPIQLISLPPETIIKRMEIHCEWLVFITDQSVIFLHLYRPTQNFLTLSKMKAQHLAKLGPNKIIIFEYKYFHVYQLFTHKNPILLGTSKTKKIVPFSIAYKKNAALIGGINYSFIMNQPTPEKLVCVIQNFGEPNFKDQKIVPNMTLQICKKKQSDPILNLLYLEKFDLFLCTCSQSIYLFHLESESILASIDLLSPVRKIYEISYPINIVNFLVRIKDCNELLRVSFDQHCGIMGTQVNKIESYGECLDFWANLRNIYITDGLLIKQYGKENLKIIYGCEQEEKITRIKFNEQGLVFAVKSNNLMEFCFLEI